MLFYFALRVSRFNSGSQRTFLHCLSSIQVQAITGKKLFFQIMPPRKKTMGRGAIVSCLAKLLHPSGIIRSRFPNMNKGKKLEKLLVLRQERKVVNRIERDVLVVQSDEFMLRDDAFIELYAVAKFFRIETEGPPEGFFTQQPLQQDATVETTNEGEALPEEVITAINNSTVTRCTQEDIDNVRGVVEIDDDNDPAPENVPNAVDNSDCVYSENWGHAGHCFRRMENATNWNPTLLVVFQNTPTLVDLFETLFPKQFVINVIIPQTNQKLAAELLTYGEFLKWLGVWFLMATIQGPSRHDYWRNARIDMYSGAPYRFNDIIKRSRFDAILSALTLTGKTPPLYVDRFFQVRELIAAWNENMFTTFSPGWISCLDESMMTWTNKYSCPGFMFVPRKPHPFGNEWHTICCGLSSIMFSIELVEGKDRPPQREPIEFENLGKTGGLLLRLTKSLWNSAKVVVLDSGFCVLKALIELRQKGVYAAALVKKRRYWPKHIKGEEIKEHFSSKQVGDADARKGTLDNTPFYVFGMKEPDYTMVMMSTYGTLNRVGATKRRDYVDNGIKRQITFQYPEVISNHFTYRHMVDDHNSRRHSPISLEATWATKSWENRVFAFLLAITEVNINLAHTYFYTKETVGSIDFRKDFAKALINNRYQRVEVTEASRRSRRRLSGKDHELLTLPKNRKFSANHIVPAAMAYPQFKCHDCPKKRRTYCSCSPGIIRCSDCYAEHVRDSDI
jgi:Transposase IS4